MKLNPTFFFLLLFLASGTVFSQDATRGADLYKTCVQCHGADGQGVVEQEGPRIAGQYDWYVAGQIKAFQSKDRSNPKMYPFIKNLSEKDVADIAAYVSTMAKK